MITTPRSLISSSSLSNCGSLIVGVQSHDSLVARPHRATPTCRSIQRHAKIGTSWTLGPRLTQQCTKDSIIGAWRTLPALISS